MGTRMRLSRGNRQRMWSKYAWLPAILLQCCETPRMPHSFEWKMLIQNEWEVAKDNKESNVPPTKYDLIDGLLWRVTEYTQILPQSKPLYVLCRHDSMWLKKYMYITNLFIMFLRRSIHAPRILCYLNQPPSLTSDFLEWYYSQWGWALEATPIHHWTWPELFLLNHA